VVVVGSKVCSRLKFLQEVHLVQRLFAQMVIWHKAGDHFAVGSWQKSATNGCKAVSRVKKSKANPNPLLTNSTPCSNPLATWMLGRLTNPYLRI
jgi:hypothetical protein